MCLDKNKHLMGCGAQAGLKMHIHVHFFRLAILTRNVGQTGLVFVAQSASLVGLCMEDYNSVFGGYFLCHSG